MMSPSGSLDPPKGPSSGIGTSPEALINDLKKVFSASDTYSALLLKTCQRTCVRMVLQVW